MMKQSWERLALALVAGLVGIAGAATALPAGSQYIDSGYCVKAGDVVTAVFTAAREQPDAESGVFGREQTVKAGEKMSFTLAPGGGFIIRFTRK